MQKNSDTGSLEFIDSPEAFKFAQENLRQKRMGPEERRQFLNWYIEQRFGDELINPQWYQNTALRTEILEVTRDLIALNAGEEGVPFLDVSNGYSQIALRYAMRLPIWSGWHDSAMWRNEDHRAGIRGLRNPTNASYITARDLDYWIRKNNEIPAGFNRWIEQGDIISNAVPALVYARLASTQLGNPAQANHFARRSTSMSTRRFLVRLRQTTNAQQLPAQTAPKIIPKTTLEVIASGRGQIIETSPVRIPGYAKITLRTTRSGRFEIRYTWREGGWKYRARFHDPSRGAPEGAKPSWVIEREKPGVGARPPFGEVYIGDNIWLSRKVWFRYSQASSPTQAQQNILRRGHFEVD